MLERYYIDKGAYKEIIRDDKSLFKCPYCGLWFKGLAYHTNQKHGVTGSRLREIFKLKANYQLTTPDVKERHRQIVFENKQSHIFKNLILNGKKTRFGKGCKGHVKSGWSSQALAELSKRRRRFQNGK